MRRLSFWLLLVTPMLVFSCAQGNTLGRFGEYGAGAGDPGPDSGGHPEGEDEPDPGSPDPGQGGADPGGMGGGDAGEDCAHDPCAPGAPLDENCHPCVFEVCSADAYCCQGEWDDTCIGQATSCGCDPGGAGGAGQGGAGGDPGGFGGGDPGGFGGSDPGGLGGSDPGPVGDTCAHDLCIVGELLDPSCDPCVDEICQNDDYCCTVEWDTYCLLDAISTCPQNCL